MTFISTLCEKIYQNNKFLAKIRCCELQDATFGVVVLDHIRNIYEDMLITTLCNAQKFAFGSESENKQRKKELFSKGSELSNIIAYFSKIHRCENYIFVEISTAIHKLSKKL